MRAPGVPASTSYPNRTLFPATFSPREKELCAIVTTSMPRNASANFNRLLTIYGYSWLTSAYPSQCNGKGCNVCISREFVAVPQFVPSAPHPLRDAIAERALPLAAYIVAISASLLLLAGAS